MATILQQKPRAQPWAADTLERVLATAASILFAAMLIALFKGRADWAELPPALWLHLATIATALALTPVMLLRPRGDRWHRRLGWVWVGSMLLTAIGSLFIRQINDGGFSLIHILSVWTIIQTPLIAWSAKTHNVKRHRSSVRSMVTGALLVAGFFTFPFDRLLGHWLFS